MHNPTNWVILILPNMIFSVLSYISGMISDTIYSWFMPQAMRYNKAHPQYYEFYTVVATLIGGVIAICLFPILLAWFGVGKYLWMYYLNVACNIVTLFSIRYFATYRITNYISAITGYIIIYTWLEDTGFIYSVNMCIVHMFLISGVIADKKWGWSTIITNLVFIIYIYYQTVHANTAGAYATLGSPIYALIMHCLITFFLGGFLAYTSNSNEESRKKIIAMRDQKINLLDDAVRQRTEQLNNMRQTIAADFHDQTGNMLAAINRQAAILELKLQDQPEIIPLVQSIITNSNGLYASSKDFLWNLNNDSDNPFTLFQYLTAYGQNFYNQFDIRFSANSSEEHAQVQQLNPFAALNLIYIFKEAMSNVVKHSGADEATMSMMYQDNEVTFVLADNGTWKEADPGTAHYGLNNIERRSQKSGFAYKLIHGAEGTQVSISLPLNNFIS